MTVAGYWFSDEQAARFSRDWNRELGKLGLMYAHMTDCALGFGQYKPLTLDQRIESGKLLIQHIKRRSRFGFAITVNPIAYGAIMSGIRGAPSCYSLCLMMLFQQVSNFVAQNNFNGTIRYVFESGHASEKEARRYLNEIPKHGEQWVAYTRYGGHEFADKRKVLPLQAADMLAWQTRHYYKRTLDGYPNPRKDFVALVRLFDFTAILSGDALLALKDTFVELAPLIEAGSDIATANKAAEILNRYNLAQQPAPSARL